LILTLKQATLENFKGIAKQVIGFGKITNIFGANEAGKSRIYNAYLWNLQGKDSRNRADYEIKTRVTPANKNLYPDMEIGEIVHKLEYSVALAFDHDGTKLELKRALEEKWIKSRNEFKANTTKYQVNGLEGLKKVYDKKVNDIIPENLFRILTDTKFFNSDDFGWESRRKILTEMAGQDDETTLDGYDLIKDILQGMSTEDRRKTLKSTIKKLKEQREEIPVAIKENQIKIKDYGSQDEIEAAIRGAEGKRDDIKLEIERIKADSGVNELKQKIEEVKTERLTRSNEFETGKDEKLKPVNDKIAELINEETSLKIKIDDLKTKSKTLQNSVDFDKGNLKNLQSKYVSIKNLPETVDEICPTCGQDLPPENIGSAIDQLKLEKSNQLEQNKKEGEALVKKIKSDQSLIESNTEAINGLFVKLQEIRAAFESLGKEKGEIESNSADYGDLDTKIQEYQKQIDAGGETDTSPLEKSVSELQTQIDSLKETLLNISKNQEYRDRIKELEDQEKTLSQSQADLEKQLSKIQAFIFNKTKIVEEKVNGLFKVARFSMFKLLQNGETEEICETLKDGIPYNSLNSAGQMQVGIDIIDALQKFYDVRLPTWIDNREGVTEIPETDLQIINLIVSPEDTELRVEHG
jgi:DNA repair exonuclease SbcCD ATPase subunit